MSNLVWNHGRGKRLIERYIWHFAFISVLVACVSHVLVFNFHHVIPESLVTRVAFFDERVVSSPALLRAYLYFMIMYVSFIPIYLGMMMCIGSELDGSRNNVPDKLLLTIGGLPFLCTLSLTPFLILTDTAKSNWRGWYLHKLMVDSFVGLVVVGAILSYTVTLVLWMMLRVIPSMWMRRTVWVKR